MRYHKEIGFPTSLIVPKKMINLSYCEHAKMRAKDRGSSILPSFVKLTEDNVIEVTTADNGAIDRVLVRTTYDKSKDICLVIAINTGKVITLWINSKRNMMDIDKTKYDTP